MLEIWYWALHIRAPSCSNGDLRIPKSSAALGFGFELLNSGERFRAILTLMLELKGLSMKIYPYTVMIINSHILYRWYHGRLDGKTAEHHLLDNEAGSYLTRESESKPGSYILSHLGHKLSLTET